MVIIFDILDKERQAIKLKLDRLMMRALLISVTNRKRIEKNPLVRLTSCPELVALDP